MSKLRLYNSLDRQISDFEPKGKKVTMYFCGPTVYSYQHIGNMRAFVMMDLMRRAIKYNGYNITGVMNITDVGHLTSDADEGEDKMVVASRKEKKSPWEIAEYYTEICLNDMRKLNIDMPEHIIKATSVVEETIELVKQLLDKGFAYKTPSAIYYDISKFPQYGALSGISLEDKKAGARVEVDPNKKHPADFALWIKAPKEHIMKWDSPWGKGYPGWHMECSTIGHKYLGNNIDIHGGGVEHKTVHHENEIAQNYGITGENVVGLWFHFEHLMVDGKKMSKSLGTTYRVADLEERGFRAIDLKYFFLTAHYSKQQNFTFEALSGAQSALNKIYAAVSANKNGKDVVDDSVLNQLEGKFLEAVNDNLNIPTALAVVWELLKIKEKNNKIYKLLLKFDRVLGVDLANAEKYISAQVEDIPEEVVALAEERIAVRKNKDWAKSDILRDKIKDLGYEVQDNKDGYELRKR